MKLKENPYYSLDSISNSKLSFINPEQAGSPALFKAVNAGMMERKEHMSLERGKLVHLFALERDSFKVADVEKPSDSERLVIDDMYWNGDSATGFTKNELLLAVKRVGFRSNWGDEAKLKLLDTPKNRSYYEHLCEEEEYIFLSSTEEAVVKNALDSISRHPEANLWINSDDWSGYECYNEMTVEATDPFTGLNLKGLLDRLMIHHKSKTIYIPDLKTTSKSVDMFRESYEYFRYYRQHAFYGYLIDLTFEELIKKGYKVEYRSVVTNINPSGLFETRVYNIHPDWIKRGVKERMDLLNRIKFHEEHGWDYPMEHVLNQQATGKLEVTLTV